MPPAKLDLARRRLTQLAGQRATIDIASLPADLHIVAASRQRLGHGSFSHTGQTVTHTPTTPVIVRQGRVKAAAVGAYLDALAAGEDVHPISVTDRPADGRLWHLNGAHRLVASRLLGCDITASVWR